VKAGTLDGLDMQLGRKQLRVCPELLWEKPLEKGHSEDKEGDRGMIFSKMGVRKIGFEDWKGTKVAQNRSRDFIQEHHIGHKLIKYGDSVSQSTRQIFSQADTQSASQSVNHSDRQSDR
jgi:hypothetical protein